MQKTFLVEFGFFMVNIVSINFVQIPVQSMWHREGGPTDRAVVSWRQNCGR